MSSGHSLLSIAFELSKAIPVLIVIIIVIILNHYDKGSYPSILMI